MGSSRRSVVHEVPGGAGRRAVGAAVWVGLAVLATLYAGCGASKFTRISETKEAFDQNVLRAEKPVLVEFFKGGCATRGFLEPTLNQLADEYAGRLDFISFEMMRAYLAISCPEVRKRHRIAYYPTVILFDKGEEKKRWILDFKIDNYRTVLTELVGAPAPKEPRTEAAAPSDEQAMAGEAPGLWGGGFPWGRAAVPGLGPGAALRAAPAFRPSRRYGKTKEIPLPCRPATWASATSAAPGFLPSSSPATGRPGSARTARRAARTSRS